ncbi:hypothetical protein VZT92_021288 [Zoarces viviparus]|uniref:Uncharacterized protein n=1 Tax=Zoarces viviparus TaxID=48416 RepID=A0AAW1EH16_ZOAVI
MGEYVLQFGKYKGKKRKSAVQLLSPASEAGPQQPSCAQQLPRGVREEHLLPPRVFSLSKDQDMVTEMTCRDFSQSDCYEAERERWIAERN